MKLFNKGLQFFLLFAFFPLHVFAASLENVQNQWIPQEGDVMTVDVSSNTGYFLHPDGSFLSFPVATGQKRNVSYIGLYYYAATPVQQWKVQSMDIKSDRVTFGKAGRFLRLYRDDEQTAYGIHAYNPETWMFRDGDRYRSMGCIVVQETILDIIEATYHLNGNVLLVETKDEFMPPAVINLEHKELESRKSFTEIFYEFFF